MEYTKESLTDTYILVTSKTQGERIIKFYESFGFNNVGRTHRYLPANGSFIIALKIGILINTISIDNIKKDKKLIKLPIIPHKKKLTFPREMMVTDMTNPSPQYWQKVMVVGWCPDLKYPFLIESEIRCDGYIGHKYAKEIE